MTEGKLISKVDIACEELLHSISKVESITEDGKLILSNRLKEVQIEIKYKATRWED
jgi:hypothetical protein